MSSSKIVRPDKRTKQRRAIMPFIQCDLEVGLSDKEKTALVRKMTEVTHRAIGSAYGHINVVLREHSASNLGEAGEPRADFKTQRQGREQSG
jgi:phenylpyruvate tautomerase PptA (4-oxalocrotonate tautomerase family)